MFDVNVNIAEANLQSAKSCGSFLTVVYVLIHTYICHRLMLRGISKYVQKMSFMRHLCE